MLIELLQREFQLLTERLHFVLRPHQHLIHRQNRTTISLRQLLKHTNNSCSDSSAHRSSLVDSVYEIVVLDFYLHMLMQVSIIDEVWHDCLEVLDPLRLGQYFQGDEISV